jgi:hypothetical protein
MISGAAVAAAVVDLTDLEGELDCSKDPAQLGPELE